MLPVSYYETCPGEPPAVHFASYDAPRDPPADADACRMVAVATEGRWRLLRGPLGGWYADCGDRHGWYALGAVTEAEAIDAFADLCRRVVAE